ncbi:MAG TPA: 50S ribosomal protein L5 [Candidatus Atribacteria bacterium]|nr:MAG: 50S ribosomal protein L5 [Atribacteria bacterium 34_128]HAJ31809.1 50S ribosomal protein L5 [Candidatus Atribacteria bacterium]
MPRLKDKYLKQVVPEMMKKFKYKSVMAVPRLQKTIINIGLGSATKDSKIMDEAVKELAVISGQKPIITRAKKSISNFGIRKDMPVGCKVTLRSDRMYEFLDKFINIAIARIRDFRGIPSDSFDGRGNYTVGVKEQLIFPEIDFDQVTNTLGMNITIVTSALNDEEGKALLELMGLPFKK